MRPLWCGENSKKWVNLCREKMRKCGEMRIGQEGGGQTWPSPNLHYSLYYNYNGGNTIGTIVRTVGRGIWRFIQGRGSVVLCWLLLLILLFWSGLKAGIITKTETEYHWMPGSSLAPLTMDQLSWNTAKWCCFHPSRPHLPTLAWSITTDCFQYRVKRMFSWLLLSVSRLYLHDIYGNL